MSKIEEAREILLAMGMPSAQRNEMAALTLLALCSLKPDDPWSLAHRRSITVSKGIMSFVHSEYGRLYAPNTRETFRRQVLHQFAQGNIVEYNPDNPSLPTNSPKAHYAITPAALQVVQSFGTSNWENAIQVFVLQQGGKPKRGIVGIPIDLPNDTSLILSPGEHNRLQVAVVEQFAPRFASGAELLYLGDTANKDFYVVTERLVNLEIPLTEHDKLPDIIFYSSAQNWLFLVEAVTSHGPMTPTRIMQLKQMLAHCTASPVFITAFQNFAEFRKHLKNIAWDTEVWIAEVPDHLIHFNGDRFFGPRTE